MTSRAANSVSVLRSEISKIWPSLVLLDHPPEIFAGNGHRISNAVDFSSGRGRDTLGLLVGEQISMLARTGHPALSGRGACLISNRRYCSPATQWRWRRYLGKPYLDHVHLQVGPRPEAYDSTIPWGVSGWAKMPLAADPVSAPNFQPWNSGSVIKLQRRLNRRFPTLTPISQSGTVDAVTVARVIEFQIRSRLVADGVIGPRTLAKLGM